jgi:hypothetical protein
MSDLARFDSLKSALETMPPDSAAAASIIQDAAPGCTAQEIIQALRQVRLRVRLWDDEP